MQWRELAVEVIGHVEVLSDALGRAGPQAKEYDKEVGEEDSFLGSQLLWLIDPGMTGSDLIDLLNRVHEKGSVLRDAENRNDDEIKQTFFDTAGWYRGLIVAMAPIINGGADVYREVSRHRHTQEQAAARHPVERLDVFLDATLTAQNTSVDLRDAVQRMLNGLDGYAAGRAGGPMASGPAGPTGAKSSARTPGTASATLAAATPAAGGQSPSLFPTAGDAFEELRLWYKQLDKIGQVLTDLKRRLRDYDTTRGQFDDLYGRDRSVGFSHPQMADMSAQLIEQFAFVGRASYFVVYGMARGMIADAEVLGNSDKRTRAEGWSRQFRLLIGSAEATLGLIKAARDELDERVRPEWPDIAARAETRLAQASAELDRLEAHLAVPGPAPQSSHTEPLPRRSGHPAPAQPSATGQQNKTGHGAPTAMPTAGRTKPGKKQPALPLALDVLADAGFREVHTAALRLQRDFADFGNSLPTKERRIGGAAGSLSTNLDNWIRGVRNEQPTSASVLANKVAIRLVADYDALASTLPESEGTIRAPQSLLTIAQTLGRFGKSVDAFCDLVHRRFPSGGPVLKVNTVVLDGVLATIEPMVKRRSPDAAAAPAAAGQAQPPAVIGPEPRAHRHAVAGRNRGDDEKRQMDITLEIHEVSVDVLPNWNYECLLTLVRERGAMEIRTCTEPLATGVGEQSIAVLGAPDAMPKQLAALVAHEAPWGYVQLAEVRTRRFLRRTSRPVLRVVLTRGPAPDVTIGDALTAALEQAALQLPIRWSRQE